MISFIILIGIVGGLFAMANKMVNEYDYGMSAIEEFENNNKDSFYFK